MLVHRLRQCHPFLAVALLAFHAVSIGFAQEKQIGFDANYVIDMEQNGQSWTTSRENADLYETLAEAGGNAARVRLWTNDGGMNGLEYATETARRAQQAGLKPYLVIFLSDNWSDMVKQPVPAVWSSLSQQEKLAAIESYAEKVARHFEEAGIEIDLYEIGNEIDFGICGVFEEEWPKRVSIEYMRSRIWVQMVPMIRAAQAGVRKVNPDARFTLHLAQWSNTAYSVAFWEHMIDQGVTVDVAGVSYFPTSADPGERSLEFFRQQLARLHQAIDRPLLVCEFAYPVSENFPGQFAAWNKPIDGYDLDIDGQKAWIADFLTEIRQLPFVTGAYYWSPEWYGSEIWDAFALFDKDGKARPGLSAFADRSSGDETR